LRAIFSIPSALSPLLTSISPQLWYYDDRTPSDWEPRYFASADPSDLSFSRHGDHDHLRIRIGEVTTPYHSLKVRVVGGADFKC
ncbi:unnamed protein product, partial [Discosporangium mesarthrocarpum]